ncbi:MAG: peptidoglycan bridge formation glycyltransferase FemA/FemB family protein [Erysipelotrichales bacterium]|nr:MAG: peptidoglycan bridge formation glycyltransferase FemA/FemB family protein [Erysipelotrichales bacterium]
MRTPMELIRTEDKTSFDRFAENQVATHYSKLSFWGEFEARHYDGMEFWRFETGDETVATAILLKKLTLFGTTWYIPNGPSLDYFDEQTLKQVLTRIKSEAIRSHILYVRIDNNIPRRPHDQKGEVTEGFNHEFITERFEAVGFNHTGYRYGYSGYLFSRFTYVLDLTPDFNALVEQVAPNVRNSYRKNLRRGVEVRDGNRDELRYLVEYGQELADKLEFKAKPLRFFQDLFDLAGEHAVYRVASADLHLALETINTEREALLDSIRKVEGNPKKAGFIKEVQRQIEDLNHEETDITRLIQTQGPTIILGSALYLLAGNRSYNVYTYTNKDFPSFHATISLHMESIKELKNRGIRYYDFVGVSGSLDPHDKYYGLYDFKSRFGGEFMEHLGEFYFKPRPKLAHIQQRLHFYQRTLQRRSYAAFLHLKAKFQTNQRG